MVVVSSKGLWLLTLLLVALYYLLPDTRQHRDQALSLLGPGRPPKDDHEESLGTFDMRSLPEPCWRMAEYIEAVQTQEALGFDRMCEPAAHSDACPECFCVFTSSEGFKQWQRQVLKLRETKHVPALEAGCYMDQLLKWIWTTRQNYKEFTDFAIAIHNTARNAATSFGKAAERSNALVQYRSGCLHAVSCLVGHCDNFRSFAADDVLGRLPVARERCRQLAAAHGRICAEGSIHGMATGAAVAEPRGWTLLTQGDPQYVSLDCGGLALNMPAATLLPASPTQQAFTGLVEQCTFHVEDVYPRAELQWLKDPVEWALVVAADWHVLRAFQESDALLRSTFLALTYLPALYDVGFHRVLSTFTAFWDRQISPVSCQHPDVMFAAVGRLQAAYALSPAVAAFRHVLGAVLLHAHLCAHQRGRVAESRQSAGWLARAKLHLCAALRLDPFHLQEFDGNPKCPAARRGQPWGFAHVLVDSAVWAEDQFRHAQSEEHPVLSLEARQDMPSYLCAFAHWYKELYQQQGAVEQPTSGVTSAHYILGMHGGRVGSSFLVALLRTLPAPSNYFFHEPLPQTTYQPLTLAGPLAGSRERRSQGKLRGIRQAVGPVAQVASQLGSDLLYGEISVNMITQFADVMLNAFGTRSLEGEAAEARGFGLGDIIDQYGCVRPPGVGASTVRLTMLDMHRNLTAQLYSMLRVGWFSPHALEQGSQWDKFTFPGGSMNSWLPVVDSRMPQPETLFTAQSAAYANLTTQHPVLTSWDPQKSALQRGVDYVLDIRLRIFWLQRRLRLAGWLPSQEEQAQVPGEALRLRWHRIDMDRLFHRARGPAYLAEVLSAIGLPEGNAYTERILNQRVNSQQSNKEVVGSPVTEQQCRVALMQRIMQLKRVTQDRSTVQDPAQTGRQAYQECVAREGRYEISTVLPADFFRTLQI